MRSLLTAFLLFGAAPAYTEDQASSAPKTMFDGDILRAGGVAAPVRDWGPLARLIAKDGLSLNFCAPELLVNSALPRAQFVLDGRIVCDAPAGADPVSGLVALAAPGELGGGLGGRGIRALLGARSFEDADFRRRLGLYYASIAADPSAAPGWAWALAMKAADSNPSLAARLAAFCGHDDLDPAQAREPIGTDAARADFAAATAILKARLSIPAAPPADPLSSSKESLAANDRLTAQDRLASLSQADFAVRRAPICPALGSKFYKTDALGAGPAHLRRRVFAGALLACEMARTGAVRAVAETATSNVAWVDRLIRISREARALAEGRRLADGGALGELAPARADAFRLLAGWNPDAPFPGPLPASKPAAWSAERYAAATGALKSMGAQWRESVEDYATGARFGANACSSR